MSIDCPPIIFGCALYVAFPPISSNRKPKIHMENSKSYISMTCINNNENSSIII